MFKVLTRKTSPGRLCFARHGKCPRQAAKRPCTNENVRFPNQLSYADIWADYTRSK